MKTAKSVVLVLILAAGCATRTVPPITVSPPVSAATEEVGPPLEVTQLVSGYMHTCALRSDGRVVCWGRLYTETVQSEPEPVPTDKWPTTRVDVLSLD